jgi:hypothetical protein
MSKEMIQYNRPAAVAYAHRWAYSRNPAYYNYDKLGGDCTNFVSQCVFAGARVMNYTHTYGWYYLSANNKSPSWSGVEFLYDFLVRGRGGPGPAARETPVSGMAPGDVIQLLFDGKVFQHSLLVVETGPAPAEDTILVATHSDDQDNKPLSTYQYQRARFLHIQYVNG